MQKKCKFSGPRLASHDLTHWAVTRPGGLAGHAHDPVACTRHTLPPVQRARHAGPVRARLGARALATETQFLEKKIFVLLRVLNVEVE